MTALFIAQPDGTCRLALRRYRHGDSGDSHRHDTTVFIDDNATELGRDHDGIRRTPRDLVPHDDPRWPGTCGCGEPFTDLDEWQVIQQSWYEGGGHRFPWGIGAWDGPPGAMIRATWRDIEGRPPAWTVFLPNGTFWSTNDRASAGGNGIGDYWEVTGEAPAITVHPSIDDRGSRPWHGWIRDGQFINA
jgi:hypothetical protein